MELDFIKLSPLGNTTVFLRGEAAQEARAALLAEAMDYDHLAAEQAGFLVAPHSEEALLRIEMSGGEFCGNATLSAAALAAAEGAESPFFIECSGAEGPLRAEARPLGAGHWLARAEMPQAHELRRFSLAGLSFEGQPFADAATCVSLPGIAHLVVEAADLSAADYDELLARLMRETDADAYGVVPFERMGRDHFRIRPYVAVPRAESRVFERACGSGSLALALALGDAAEGTRIAVDQPGGTLFVETGRRFFLEGEALISCRGTVELAGVARQGVESMRSMNIQEMADCIAAAFLQHEQYRAEHRKEYGEVLAHVFAMETINTPMLHEFESQAESEAFQKYCGLIEHLWKNGDDEVRNVVDVTILESISDDGRMWQAFGRHISQNFRDYINKEVLTKNIVMVTVPPLPEK